MPCPFCESKEVIRFHEHYHFCTNCSAIWTYPIVVEGCEHIPPNTKKAHDTPIPYIIRKPWYKSLPLGIYIYKDRCSECGEIIRTNGW